MFSFFIFVYCFCCFGFDNLKNKENGIAVYKNDTYYICNDFRCVGYNVDDLKLISFEAPNLIIFSGFWSFAKTKDSPEIIITPKFNVYFRSDIDYKNLKFYLYFAIINEKIEKTIELGYYSINELIGNEKLIESNQFYTLGCGGLRSNDSLGLYMFFDVIKYNNTVYIEINDVIYEPTDLFLELLKENQ